MMCFHLFDTMAKDVCLLFDVDGTLTHPRSEISHEMLEYIRELQAEEYTLAVVGGSNETKIREQLGDSLFEEFDYAFPENGVVAYDRRTRISDESIQNFLGDEKIGFLMDSTLRALSEIKIPKKRGTFIELRKGLINISPIGRDCSQKERDEFEKYDHVYKVREKLIDRLQKEYGEKFGLKFSIGGQISFDVFPHGWDKTYCLQFLPEFRELHFFGDKTELGGNDHEIYIHPRTIGHKVGSYWDTIKVLNTVIPW